ncbi:hypothetical protein NDU88_006421 [Pleurodeles waltl]|uniref:Uncharacterized protein n=1 Tax=Pleurodeles waltl TaxID=8319 RepID=A0AAV7N3E4_PLEWA|nr:hypothetical protein NDU88_006421 [Pleurodeles waltl]
MASSDVFSKKPGRTRLIQHHIRTIGDRVAQQRPYRIPEAKRQVVEQEPQSRGGECDGPFTASRPECPRGTEDSAWLHPEALVERTNEECLPEHSGLHGTQRDAFWCPGEAEEDEEDRRDPFSAADDSYGDSHQQQPKGDDTVGISVTPGSEDQEAETAPVRPRSRKSVAFTGTVSERTVLPSKKD